MFKFFQKKPLEEDNKEENLASISYIIKKDAKTAYVDIELKDYEEEYIDALCQLLDILGNELFYFDTVNMVKTSLMQENKHDALIKILTKINSKIRAKIYSSNMESYKDEPCIKPSEMFKR